MASRLRGDSARSSSYYPPIHAERETERQPRLDQLARQFLENVEVRS